MAGCSELEIGLDPSCDALKKVGGVNARVWATQRKNIVGFTYDATGKHITGFTMKETAVSGIFERLHKFISKRDKHNFNATGTKGENAATYNHSGVIALAAFTQLENEAVEGLFNADDVVLFIQTNSDQIKVYGHGIGLNGTNLEAPEGVLLNDSTMILVTLEGEERKLPMVMNVAPGTLADNIAYLDGKDGTGA